MSNSDCQTLAEIFSQSGASGFVSNIPVIGGFWTAATTPEKLILWGTQPCVRWKVILGLGAVVVAGMGMWLLFRREMEGAVSTVAGTAVKAAAL